MAVKLTTSLRPQPFLCKTAANSSSGDDMDVLISPGSAAVPCMARMMDAFIMAPVWLDTPENDACLGRRASRCAFFPTPAAAAAIVRRGRRREKKNSSHIRARPQGVDLGRVPPLPRLGLLAADRPQPVQAEADNLVCSADEPIVVHEYRWRVALRARRLVVEEWVGVGRLHPEVLRASRVVGGVEPTDRCLLREDHRVERLLIGAGRGGHALDQLCHRRLDQPPRGIGRPEEHDTRAVRMCPPKVLLGALQVDVLRRQHYKVRDEVAKHHNVLNRSGRSKIRGGDGTRWVRQGA
eukprot:scaffold22276_cov68-Phaeocystis_antarctica.AAC.4